MKKQVIDNIIQIILLELENYNMTADYGFELSIDDVVNHLKSQNKNV